MAGYTKADFAARYRVYAVDPVTRHRYARFRSPDIAGGAELTCLLHYHPAAIKPQAAEKAERIADWYWERGVPLSDQDCVVVIGGAFGWLGEALEDLIPGLEALSVDTSDYVQQVKGQSADDELAEQLQASGYDIAQGPGKFLFDKFSGPRPRCRRPEMVVNEDLSTNRGRNAVRRLFARNSVTRIITEEVWQILTPEEQTRYRQAAAAYGASLLHIVDNMIVE